jgi:hypothetical protein
MRYVGVLTAIAVVPILIFGMAMLGARVYSAGTVTLVDVVGFALQIILVVVLVLMAIGLWRALPRSAKST